MTLPKLRNNISDWATDKVHKAIPAIDTLWGWEGATPEETRAHYTLVGDSLLPAIDYAFALGIQAALNPAMLAFVQDGDEEPTE